jgi:hypothetical protein
VAHALGEGARAEEARRERAAKAAARLTRRRRDWSRAARGRGGAPGRGGCREERSGR